MSQTSDMTGRDMPNNEAKILRDDKSPSYCYVVGDQPQYSAFGTPNKKSKQTQATQVYHQRFCIDRGRPLTVVVLILTLFHMAHL